MQSRAGSRAGSGGNWGRSWDKQSARYRYDCDINIAAEVLEFFRFKKFKFSQFH